MKQLNANAKQFVEGIVEHLRKDKTGEKQSPKVKSLLKKVSSDVAQEGIANVMTAVSLSEKEKKEIAQILSHKLGHEVELSCTVQSDLIGGIRIEIADYIIDLSYKEELESIGQMLVKGSHI